MKFNDYEIISPKNSEIIASEYKKILEQESRDLEEILNKLQLQKNDLLTLSNPSYKNIIDKISKDIDSIESIIRGTKRNVYNTPGGHISLTPKNNQKVAKLDDNSRLSPYRSLDEMNELSENNLPSIPPQTIPQNPQQTTPQTPYHNNIKSSNRGRPMQSFNLFNRIAKTFLRKKDSDDHYRMKYHILTTDTCNIHNINTRQIDIIRLLLLYLTLRPNCHYCSLISSIANNQFECYLELN